MKILCLIALLVMMVFCVIGCISTADQIRLNNLTAEQKEKVDALIAERVAAYLLIEKQTTEIKGKIESGSVSLDEGKKYIELLRSEMAATVEKVERQIKDTKEAYSAEQQRIVEAGSSKGEYYIGLIVSAIAAFTGVNVYRSRKHPLTKEIV